MQGFSLYCFFIMHVLYIFMIAGHAILAITAQGTSVFRVMVILQYEYDIAVITRVWGEAEYEC